MNNFWLLAFLIKIGCAEIFFSEDFSRDPMADWIASKHPGVEWGNFTWDPEEGGIRTSQDARFYALSRKFPPFSNENKPLVVQFTVRHKQNIDCGGGYLKIFDCSLDQEDLHGESPYLLMFGPDICGPGTKKVHVIFNYKGRNLLIKKDIRCQDDTHTHLYTFIIRPDNTYEVLIDNEKVEGGKLEEDWDFLLPMKIKDPSQSKPADWVDNPTIPDPDDKKPEDWDKPEHIPDPEASKPDDWDDEMDGEWEAPMIDNPEFKGKWEPKEIDNPNYKGPWEHPEIDNPEYTPDPHLYKKSEVCAIGFDLWQVKSGTIFDNILLADDPEEAREIGERVWKTQLEDEKKEKERLDDEDKSRDKESDEDLETTRTNDDDEDEDDIPENAIPDEEHDEL